MKTVPSMEFSILGSLSGITSSAWDALVPEGNPFMEHGFLSSLEDSGAIGPGTAWSPRHLIGRSGKKLVAAAPAYWKSDSYGEFVPDWDWAAAYARAGLSYYPKLLVTVPFTPVTGRRFLTGEGIEREAAEDSMTRELLRCAQTEQASSLHILFPTADEVSRREPEGFFSRHGFQFHWMNRGYRTFEDYLGDLRASRRKQIKKERRGLDRHGINIRIIAGSEIEERHLKAVWSFYQSTHSKKGMNPHLNEGTFLLFGERFRHRIILVLAERAGSLVAGTFNVRGEKNLYGRYWGCLEEIEHLHFECCIYRLIEYAIDEKIEIFEAGAHGEQKFLRGMLPRLTYSAHWIAHPGARTAIGRFLDEERRAVARAVEDYTAISPMKWARGR